MCEYCLQPQRRWLSCPCMAMKKTVGDFEVRNLPFHYADDQYLFPSIAGGEPVYMEPIVWMSSLYI